MNDFSIDSSYVILINDDNSMTTTRKRRIMQNSNLVDILCFLIHPDYAENDMENFSVSLHYHLPVSSIEVNEDLTLSDNTYGGYLLYKLPIDTGLTVESGDIHLSLTFSYKYIDENGNEIARIRKVSGAKLQIEGSSAIKPTPSEYKRQVLFVNTLPESGDRECIYIYNNEFYIWDGLDFICITKDKADTSGGTGGGIAVTGAKVGQTVTIAAVDEKGIPTAWQPEDFPDLTGYVKSVNGVKPDPKTGDVKITIPDSEIKAELDRIASNVAAAYAAAEEHGADMPETKNTDNLAETVSSIKSVKFTKQELTKEQQKQARENIGAISVDDIGTAAGAYYEQDEEPEDAPIGSFWMDTDEETNLDPGGSGGMADLTDEEYSTLVALLGEGIM